MSRIAKLMEYKVLRVEWCRRVIFELQMKQDGCSEIIPNDKLDLSRIDWNYYTAQLWTRYVPDYRR